MSTCNGLNLETLGSQLIMPKTLTYSWTLFGQEKYHNSLATWAPFCLIINSCVKVS